MTTGGLAYLRQRDAELRLQQGLPAERGGALPERTRVRGRRESLASLALRHGLTPGALQGRLQNGWPLEKALNTPMITRAQRKGKKLTK